MTRIPQSLIEWVAATVESDPAVTRVRLTYNRRPGPGFPAARAAALMEPQRVEPGTVVRAYCYDASSRALYTRQERAQADPLALPAEAPAPLAGTADAPAPNAYRPPPTVGLPVEPIDAAPLAPAMPQAGPGVAIAPVSVAAPVDARTVHFHAPPTVQQEAIRATAYVETETIRTQRGIIEHQADVIERMAGRFAAMADRTIGLMETALREAGQHQAAASYAAGKEEAGAGGPALTPEAQMAREQTAALLGAADRVLQAIGMLAPGGQPAGAPTVPPLPADLAGAKP